MGDGTDELVEHHRRQNGITTDQYQKGVDVFEGVEGSDDAFEEFSERFPDMDDEKASVLMLLVAHGEYGYEIEFE